MNWSYLPRFEWLLIDFIVLGILIWQLVSVNRDIRNDRENPKPRVGVHRGKRPP